MSEDRITITRKYVLKPTFAETKEWTNRVMEFTKNLMRRKSITIRRK